jgi:hypothetical protein
MELLQSVIMVELAHRLDLPPQIYIPLLLRSLNLGHSFRATSLQERATPSPRWMSKMGPVFLSAEGLHLTALSMTAG